MGLTISQKIIKARDSLKAKRSTWRALCEEACLLFNPEAQDLLTQAAGSEVLQPIVSTGILAQERLTSGLFSNTMSMGRGRVMDEDPKKMRDAGVKRFYTALSKAAHRRIQQSPFPEKYEEMLQGFNVRGEAVFYVHFNEKTRLHEYRVYPATKCFPVRDVAGNVIEIYREFELSAQAAVLEYGYDEVSEVIRKAFDKEDHDTNFEFIHAVRPRRERNKKRLDSQNMAFESIHVEVEKKKKVRVSGTTRMRYLVPRFYVRDEEDSGRSPAMKALPVARTLMKVVSDHMDGVELGIGPPMLLPDKDAVESAVLEAFGVSYCDMSNGQPFIYTTTGNLQLSREFIEFLCDELNKLHYVDLFAMLEQLKTGQKTAYEISQLVAERIQAISPVVNRLGSGFFAPLYEITAEDILQYGLLDVEVPSALQADAGDGQGSGFRVQYTSRLDVQLSEMEMSSLGQAIMQAVEMVTAIQSNPLMNAAVKVEEVINKIFEAKNVDTELLFSPAEFKTRVKEFLEAQAQQAQLAQMAESIKPMDPQKAAEDGSPLDLMGAALDENETMAI